MLCFLTIFLPLFQLGTLSHLFLISEVLSIYSLYILIKQLNFPKQKRIFFLLQAIFLFVIYAIAINNNYFFQKFVIVITIIFVTIIPTAINIIKT